MCNRIGIVTLAIATGMVLTPIGFAAQSVPTTVEFTPAVTKALHQDYGTQESDVVRAAILTALSKEERHDALPEGLTLKVTVQKLQPTHPTLKQQADNPALSPSGTRYLGGAALVGEVRNSNQQVLATVDYSNFVGVLSARSPSLDPWADARLSIDAFAAKLAAAWEKLPKN